MQSIQTDVEADERSRQRSRQRSIEPEIEAAERKLSVAKDIDNRVPKSKDDDRTLIILFFSMVVIGLGNRVFNKLQTIPMHNYANFLNLLTTFVYLPGYNGFASDSNC